ncbi:hypothetical protein MC378_12780 [Polaribacter sp. MSW13]|uniref:HTH luxR-type domain-containing protein n=1 Tax=Polaribacter marinus TaxID=2916838 RepID=A0A9X1VPN6_9FLAO|nr:hypothetical protein [Polaribacter marinus]MCI2230046.1 hypothetical protein [Polaribacter marinus]
MPPNVVLKLVTFFFLINYTFSFGQYRQTLHKPYKDKVDDIDVLYRNIINKSRKDSLFAHDYTQEMKLWAIENNDLELVLEAELLEAYAYWFLYGYKYPELINNLINVVDKSKKEGILHVEERAIQVISNHYWNIKKYEKAFEWLLQSSKLLDKMDAENFPNMSYHLNYIGRCYYFFKDYDKSITYYKKSSNLKKTEFNKKAVLEAQNSVGLCYQNMGELKLAESYFLKIIEDTSEFKMKTWKGIASGNLGYNYYLEGNYKKAIPLFKEDIKNALAIKETGLAAGATISLADIYLKQNRLVEAKQKIDESRRFIKQSNQVDRLRKLYPIMSKWYAVNNEADLSAVYLDSTMMAVNTYNDKYNSLKLLRANQKAQEQELVIEVGKLKTESQLKITQRNFIITLIGILLLFSFIAYWFRNKYFLDKQEIKDLELENTEIALSNAKTQLKNLTQKIRQDNNLITELNKENNSDLLSQLKGKNILTQNDWKQFQGLFNEVYPKFIPSIITNYPILTQAEVRCLCLERLDLNNNEMGLVLGISTNTIRVTKHRIRKKLDIDSQKDLYEFVQKFK